MSRAATLPARFGIHRPNSGVPKGKSFRWGAHNPAWESARNLLSGLGKSKRGLEIDGDSETQVNPVSPHGTTRRERGVEMGTVGSTGSMVQHVPLPHGWFETTDDSTGKTYFYNEHGDVSWVRPTVSIV